MTKIHRDMACAALALAIGLTSGGCQRTPRGADQPDGGAPTPSGVANETQAPDVEQVMKSNEQWRAELSEQAYHVLREKGTEPPFQNAYYDHKKPGRYVCAGCGQPLFDSAAKYDSGTGWPSFYQPVDPEAVDMEADRSMGMTRTEVLCSRCGGHLGHVFADGPKPTGRRYCINSAALDHVAPGEAGDQNEAATEADAGE